MKPEIYPSAKILFHEAEILGLSPIWEAPYGLFSIVTPHGKQFVFYTKQFGNSQLGAWISQDKYATRLMMSTHGLPCMPYLYSTKIVDINRFLDMHGKIVKKPLYGQKADNVTLITTHEELEGVLPRDFLFEKYIPGTEYRVWVFEATVVAVQEKKSVPTAENLWKKYVTNLEKKMWNKKLENMALSIAKILHMAFLAVDFIQDEAGVFWLLETNSMPGLYFLHNPDSGKPINMAKKLLLKAIEQY